MLRLQNPFKLIPIFGGLVINLLITSLLLLIRELGLNDIF